MFTSYFSNYKLLLHLGYTNIVSIAGKTEDTFKKELLAGNSFLKEYKKLAPKYEWWKEWHDNNLSNEWYIEKYQTTVLNMLDPNEVYKDLKNDAILLCYESPNKFCHRHLVARWFKSTLNIDIKEFTVNINNY